MTSLFNLPWPLNLPTQPSQSSASPTVDTFVVTNTNDTGTDSLRQAIAAANLDTSGAVDVITFRLGTGAHTITLGSTLDITAKNLTLAGPGNPANLTISGGGQVQDFKIEAGANVVLSGLSITQGHDTTVTGGGGGISNKGGTLTLNNDILSNNSALNGGGILNSGVLTVNNSIFKQNTATAGGGAIYNSVGTLTISGSVFGNNSAAVGGGAIFNGENLTLGNSTISNNSANQGGGIYNVDGIGVTSFKAHRSALPSGFLRFAMYPSSPISSVFSGI